MFKRNKIFTLCLLLLLFASTAHAAMPTGVQSFAPIGTVADNVSFRVVFRNPVVKRDSINKVITPDNELFPFEVNPVLQLEGRWQNERTFTAQLLAPLRAATTYTATLREGLRDRRGGRIGPGSFRFQTEGLSPTDIKASMGRDGNAYFDIGFNMRLDPARLKGFMSILNADNREVAYNINGSLPARSIRVSIPVQNMSQRQRFTVKIAAGLKSGEGDMGIEKDYTETVILDPELMVQELYPEEQAIRAAFNFGIDPNTAKSFIKIEPSVSNVTYESGWSDENFVIRTPDFKPRSRFVITFRKGFPSKGGLVLKEDYTQAIIMPDLDSEVSLPASGVYLTPLDNGLIPIELLNVKKLQLDLWRMYENNVPYVLKGDYDNFQRDIAKRIFTKELPLNLPLNERVRRSIPLEELAGSERGLFLLTARDTDKAWWDEASQMVNLSDIGATARLWEDAILIWANTLTTAHGVSDADVKIYSDKKQLLAQGKTNTGGVYYYELPEGQTWQQDNQPSLAIITKGQDLTYVQLTRNLLNREIFDTSGRDWLRKGYDAAIISPRDIYRTGESAYFKAIVRNADITTPEAFPVIFIIRDSLGRKVKQEAVNLNALGSAVLELNLPANALTGLWTAALAIPGSENAPITTYNFHVEDFAPPRLEVKVSSYRQFLLHNDTLTADIYARWLFGADAANLNCRTSWTAREGTFTPTQDRWKGYSFGDPSRHFGFTEGEIGEAKLDNFGASHANFTLDADWQAPTFINVTLRAEVQEDSGRWVTGTITRPYYPAPWLLGIAPASDTLAVRSDIAFKVAAVTPQEEPADPGELNAELYKVTWNYNLIEIDGRKRWQSSEEMSEVDSKTLVLRNGLGEVNFRPESYGTYVVKISDKDDNARAVYRFYASDPQYSGSGSQLIDRIEMETEKEYYKLGETARVKVKVPFEGLLMIMAEGAKPIPETRKIQRVEASEMTFNIPVTQDFRPNVWVSAWLIRPVNAADANGWASHRAIGLTRIKTDLSDYNIDVAIDAPKKIAPASKLPVNIKLTGSSAAISRNADVAIALVDDGVLGLTHYKTPNLLDHFWGLKKLNSQGFDIYDQLIPVEDRTTEQLHPGGDEALGALAGDGNVQRFKILSMFEGVLQPDAKGEIHTELELPEFSGRGRLFVVAASGRNFGHAEQQIEIARDIVTEIGLPRFAAPGDSFIIPAAVFNTSAQNMDVSVNLVPEGLMLNESYSSMQIPAGSREAFNVEAKALGGADKASLKVITSWKESNGAEKSFTQEIEMPVRAAWPKVTVGASGIFEPGTTRLDMPLDDFDGDITGTLTLADTPAVNLNRAVNFLESYPYGCLEQVISTAWPFLILPDAIAELDPLLTNDSAIRERLDGAINRIQAMQLYDGSFAMWPGTGTPYNWGSVYAAHFLLSVQNAGVNFPEEMLTGALNWLRQFLASMPAYNDNESERDDLTAKAYGVYVLTLNGERPLGWIEYLRENADMLRPSGRIYLAGAQALIDGQPDALRNISLGSNQEYSGATLESDARNTAILLCMWLDVEPQAPEVSELATRLAAMDWNSTQENSAALVALARYNVEAAGAKSSIRARLSTETSDEALLSYESGKAAAIDVQSLPKGTGILIEAQGTGQGYYSWSITGSTKSQPKPERRNLSVECVYFDTKGNALDPSQPIAHGSVVQAILTVRPSMSVSNLAVSYLLPAGFELENARIYDASSSVVNDARDDRLLLFFDRLGGEVSYGFTMRAVTRGTFSVPQVSAFGMYDPGVRFTGVAQPDIVIR